MSSLISLHVVAQFFGDRIVTIVAGTDGMRYQVHARALMASESPSLRALISEKWDPEGNKVINWSHTDSATAERFFTYLYTGDFPLPNPDPIEKQMSNDIRVSESAISRSAANSTAVTAQDSTAGPEEAISNPQTTDLEREAQSATEESFSVENLRFQTSTDDEPPDADPILQQALFESLNNDASHAIVHTPDSQPKEVVLFYTSQKVNAEAYPHSNYSYKQPLLALARLYSLAQYHLCPTLQELILCRLHDILLHFDCSQEHAVSDFVETIKYAYENSVSSPPERGCIRQTLSSFASKNYTTLMRDQFETLYAQGGDLVLDIARIIRQQLLAIGEVNRCSQTQQYLLDEISTKARDLQKQQDAIKEFQARARAITGCCNRCRSRVRSILPTFCEEFDLGIY